ncbi:hypothetical protein AB0L06_27370 [Spirillospora sp. NPDC052269]
MPPDDLTDAEQLLWDAFPTGSWADLRDAADKTVRAEVIRRLLLGGQDVEPGRLAALRLRGATVTGKLDLMGATIDVALVCENCVFDATLRLAEAVTRTVRLLGSRLNRLDAPRVRIEGVLDLRDTETERGIRVDQGEITGGLRLHGATVGRSERDVALDGEGVSVRGDLACPDLVANGPVVLRGATITGFFDLPRARLGSPGAVALDIDNASIGEGLDGTGMTVEGEIRMRSSAISGPLLLANAHLSNPGGFAVSAARAHLTGAFWCEGGLTVEGELRLTGVRFDAGLHLADARLDGTGHAALNLDRASIGHIDAPRLTVTDGDITLVATAVAGQIQLSEASLGPGRAGCCLQAKNASVGGILHGQRLNADGEISIRNSSVDAIVLMDARLTSSSGVTLRLKRNSVGRDLNCARMTSDGSVLLTAGRISGTVDFGGARLRRPGGVALEATALHAHTLILCPDEPIEGSVALDHASLSLLHDDPERWPDDLSMDGLTYENLRPDLPARDRLPWTDRAPANQRPQACEQLAANYQRQGRGVEAQRVLYERERGLRRSKPPIARAWSLLQDVTVGYGYRPWLAAAWLVFFLVIGTAVFAADHPHPLKKGEAPHFNPLVYTLDLMLPLVTLGQKSAYDPSGASQWFSYVLVAVGWILVSTIAAGVARTLTRR